MRKIISKFRAKLFTNMIESQEMLKQKVDLIGASQAEISKKLTTLTEVAQNQNLLQTGPYEVVVKLFNGLKIYLDIRDIAVGQHIALDRIWEPEITEAWLRVLRKNDTVVDIGANVGYFGLLAAHKTDKKNSKVIFIEANPHLAEIIKKTLSLNWYNEQSDVVNVALADKKGMLTLNVLKGYIGSSSIQTINQLQDYLGDKMHLEVQEKVEVSSIKLDDYCVTEKVPKVDLIKMDIEGYEEKAYSGMRKIIKKSPEATLFIEFTKEAYDNPKIFYDQLRADFGYIYLIHPNGKLYRPKKNNYEDVILGSDDWVMPVFSKRDDLNQL